MDHAKGVRRAIKGKSAPLRLGIILGKQMEKSKSPEHRVLEALFEKLRKDPTFPKNTLRRLEQAREAGKLRDVKEVVEACRLAGGENATDIPS